MKLVLSVKKSEKNGKIYRVLSIDLGYRMAALTFDDGIISEILGVSVGSLYSLSLGERVIAEINIKK